MNKNRNPHMLLDAIGKIDDVYIVSAQNRAALLPADVPFNAAEPPDAGVSRLRRAPHRAALTAAAIVIALLSSFTAAMAANEDFRNAVFRFFRISTPDVVLPIEEEPSPSGSASPDNASSDSASSDNPGQSKNADSAEIAEIEDIGNTNAGDAVSVEYLRIDGIFDYCDGIIYLYEPWEGYDDSYDAQTRYAAAAYAVEDGQMVLLQPHYETVSYPQDSAMRDGGLQDSATKDDSLQDSATKNGSLQSSTTQGGNLQDNPTQDGGLQNNPTRNGSLQSSTTQDGNLQDNPTRDGSLQNSPPRDGGLQNSATQDSSLQDSPTQDGTPKDGMATGSNEATVHGTAANEAPGNGTWQISFDWYEKNGTLYTNARNYDPAASMEWSVSAARDSSDFLILTLGFGQQIEYTQYPFLYNVRTKELLDVLARCRLPEGQRITQTAFSPNLSRILINCDNGAAVYCYDIAEEKLVSLNEASGLEEPEASFLDDNTIRCLSIEENGLYHCRTVEMPSGKCTERFSHLPRLEGDFHSGIALTGGRYGLYVNEDRSVMVYDFKSGDYATVENFKYPEDDVFLTLNPAEDKILFIRETSEADGLGVSQLGVLNLVSRTFVLLDREGYETRRETSVGWFDNDRVAIRADSQGCGYLYLYTVNPLPAN